MSTDRQPRYLPDWVKNHFQAFIERNQQVNEVLHLSINGIRMVTGRHRLMVALAEADGRVEEEADALKQAEEEKALAGREVANDFPLLHEQATIALWGSLEALVRSFLATWLMHRPEAWERDAVKRLKVRLGEYEALEKYDRCLWIVDLIDQEGSGALRGGASRFETLLQLFGLSGQVDESCQRALYELSQVRNVVVHRNGIVDRRFLTACPWLKYTLGASLRIDHSMWRRYEEAVRAYVLELIQRVRQQLGVGRSDREPAAADPNAAP